MLERPSASTVMAGSIEAPLPAPSSWRRASQPASKLTPSQSTAISVTSDTQWPQICGLCHAPSEDVQVFWCHAVSGVRRRFPA
jgi:hypothetical protein